LYFSTYVVGKINLSKGKGTFWICLYFIYLYSFLCLFAGVFVFYSISFFLVAFILNSSMQRPAKLGTYVALGHCTPISYFNVYIHVNIYACRSTKCNWDIWKRVLLGNV
jgi:hypothetical protein